MDGRPEGTGQRRGGRRPRWLVVLAMAFVLYLTFRLVEGLVWLWQWMF